ncbi:hypothetical protein COCNU_03G000880 [Cocos nucifera]|uniref:Uncharacterized protein n=1 Tax=Cocos nucifera TaxID=13894 RepID=A0A8K0I1Y3_COCNU|nr:hypothetical protein COCNU_03G000880 [Cocos nucifera]
MISSLSLLENCYCCSAKHVKRKAKQFSPYKLQVKGSSIISSNESLVNRRLAIFCSGASLVSSITANYNLTALPAKAEEKNPEDKEADGDAGVIGAIKSFFDPNEKTKSGKVLPKAYVKAAREVVKTLRESLEENTKDVAKFRRSADAAKESIREYLSGWRGQQAVVAEDQTTGRTIGVAREKNGLYHLEDMKGIMEKGNRLMLSHSQGVVCCSGESNKIIGQFLFKCRPLRYTIR